MNSQPRGPLSGLLVLDLTRYISGPYCTMILGNLGARVIKVEHPGGGDEMRAQAPFIDGESAICAGLNHGKESIALDLKKPEDRKIFEKLLKKADIFVENFRPGVMERLGYPWKVIHEMNPKLIGACVSGFGQTGPEALRACYDLVAQGMSGLMSVTGHEGSPPVKAGIDIGDLASGMFAAMGVLATLFDRTRTGQGLRVGVSLLDSLAALMVVAIGKYSVEGEVPQSTGNRHTLVAPFDAFSTKDRPITIAVANDSLFEKFCRAVGLEELISDPRFSTNVARVKHVKELTSLIQKALQKKGATEWIEHLLQHGVPAGPIHTMDEVFQEPQLAYRNMIAHFEGGYMPGFRFPGNPIKFSTYPDRAEYPRGPKLDEQREQILAWLDAHE